VKVSLKTVIMKTSVLKVIGIVEGTDKNGKDFKTISVSTPGLINAETEIGLVAVKMPTRVGTFNAWQESYLKSRKGQPDFGFDLEVGDTLMGTIVKRTVKSTLRDADRKIIGFADSYEIEDKETKEKRAASTYSAVVLADSADAVGFEQAIRDAFWQNDRPLADDSRVLAITGPARLTEPVGLGETVGA
jgi:hypothetical protein